MPKTQSFELGGNTKMTDAWKWQETQRLLQAFGLLSTVNVVTRDDYQNKENQIFLVNGGVCFITKTGAWAFDGSSIGWFEEIRVQERQLTDRDRTLLTACFACNISNQDFILEDLLYYAYNGTAWELALSRRLGLVHKIGASLVWSNVYPDTGVLEVFWRRGNCDHTINLHTLTIEMHDCNLSIRMCHGCLKRKEHSVEDMIGNVKQEVKLRSLQCLQLVSDTIHVLDCIVNQRWRCAYYNTDSTLRAFSGSWLSATRECDVVSIVQHSLPSEFDPLCDLILEYATELENRTGLDQACEYVAHIFRDSFVDIGNFHAYCRPKLHTGEWSGQFPFVFKVKTTWDHSFRENSFTSSDLLQVLMPHLPCNVKTICLQNPVHIKKIDPWVPSMPLAHVLLYNSLMQCVISMSKTLPEQIYFHQKPMWTRKSKDSQNTLIKEVQKYRIIGNNVAERCVFDCVMRMYLFVGDGIYQQVVFGGTLDFASVHPKLNAFFAAYQHGLVNVAQLEDYARLSKPRTFLTDMHNASHVVLHFPESLNDT